jgi:hypothetical protein
MKSIDEDFPPLQSVTTSHAPGLKLLREPFPAHQISTFPRNAGQRAGLSYVGHAALTDRLLDADPYWSWEPLSVDSRGLPAIDDEGGMWIRLTVCGVTRLGYGDAQGKSGGNAMKERIGDALRNAAMRFGAALDLWHKGDLHIEPETKDDDNAEYAEQQAVAVRVLFNRGDLAGAARELNTLGAGGAYDAEAKELVWGRLESNVRSAIKAYDAITQARTLDSLKTSWEASPKHSRALLEPVKDQRKAELSDHPEQAAA